MNKVKNFLKGEIVLVISFFLSVISIFLIKPDKEYVSYIDFRTLSLLFCLMAIIGGINSLGILKKTAEKLLGICKTMRGLYIALCSMCFFSSMFITNDVALITFVPLSIIALKLIGKNDKLIIITVFETIAANLGSMLTPIGNPQNLYLFSVYNMDITNFMASVLPYTVLSYLLILISSLMIKQEKISFSADDTVVICNTKKYLLLGILFVFSILTVFRLIPYYITLIITIISLAVSDREVFKQVDYSLLLTFTFLFVFIGNLGRITTVSSFLCSLVNGNEFFTGILSSQIFSNVPAAILLSGFTDNAKELLIGVNIGGLGTLIASMASLISFKIVAKEGIDLKKYIAQFTFCNIGFLALNIALWYLA